jgi:hypothetical protein
MPGDVIVDRDVGGVVVAHHAARIAVLNPAVVQRAGEACHETVHCAAADLQVDAPGGVIGVIGNRRGLEMADRVAAPVVVVGELLPQPVDVAAPTLQRQVSEHVIKRAVLQHQHDDVVDLLQIGHARVFSHHTPVAAVPACHRWPPVGQGASG